MHCTVVGQHMSSGSSLHAGVPQGAILNPLLFSLYMNDVVQATGTDVNMFADDTSVCATDKSVTGLQVKLQRAVDALAASFGSWALTVNNKKSAVMVFTSFRAVPQVTICLNGEAISQVLTHKHLGLILDSHLSWSSHVAAVTSKASWKLGLLRFLPRNLAVSSYAEFVHRVHSSCY